MHVRPLQGLRAMAAEWTEEAERIAPELLVMLERWQESYWALSRPDLCQSLGCSDRVLRAACALLRKEGHLVVVPPEGGYRLAKGYAEVVRFTATLKGRIESLAEVIGVMERVAEERFGAGAEQLGFLDSPSTGSGRAAALRSE